MPKPKTFAKTAIVPRHDAQPPRTSWWTEHRDPVLFYQQARLEQRRMSGVSSTSQEIKPYRRDA